MTAQESHPQLEGQLLPVFRELWLTLVKQWLINADIPLNLKLFYKFLHFGSGTMANYIYFKAVFNRAS